ncbi:MAG: DUF3108 domain-containing protein [Rhodobacteraceae bacterium]|nr:DUF3108 domain-containing protein [Paracoccaceae bacterium]
MFVHHIRRAALLAACLPMMLALPAVGADQTDSATFDISIRGFTAASLSINGAVKGQGYAASGVLKSAGLLGFLKKIRYDADVTGRLVKGRYVPARYHEKADTGKRQSDALMAYKAGVPQLKAYSPPRARQKGDIDPTSQGGTVDPLTALYAVLRDVPGTEACRLRLFMFDGRRRSQVVLSTPRPEGETIICTGEYRRLEGFSEKEMAEKIRFPFTLIYQPSGPGMVHVSEVSMDTLYGKGRMIRR